MTTPAEPQPSPLAADQRRRFVLWMVVGGCALALALFLYGMMGPSGKEEAQTKDCAPLAAKAEAVRHAAHGEVAALTVPVSLQKFTDLSFQGPQEQALHLTDFRGKWLLLNIWATWCVPCREEIPALDHLQEKLGSDHFEVVTINIDTAKLERRQAFFQAAGVKHLRLYADPTAQLFQILRREGKVLGLPTTFLLSPDLCHIGTMQGGGNWSSDEALGLIAAALR